MNKKCTKCGEVKPLSEFHKNKRNKDGAYSYCKLCSNEAVRKWQAEHPEYAREYWRKWYAENREKVREKYRKWYAENLEQQRERERKRRAEHPEQVRENYRKWNINNPEKVLENNRTYRARKKGNGGKITAKEWLWLKEFYDFTCLACERKEPEIELTLDHVIPLKLGGKNSIDNAQPLCRSCNCIKHAKHIDYRQPRAMEFA